MWGGAGLSVGLHIALAAMLLSLPPAQQMGIAVELDVEYGTSQGVDGVAPRGTRARHPAAFRAGGARSAQNVDSFDLGQGGDETGRRAVVLLMPRADSVTLQDNPFNSANTAQMQRIRTAGDRATREDRRATPNPHDQPFLASGAGIHRERRPVSALDAETGARRAPQPSSLGTDRTRVASQVVDPRSRARTDSGRVGEAPDPSREGAATESPGIGIQNGMGERRSTAANVAHGRPRVDEGPAATSSNWRDARVRDSQDTELLAAHLVQSAVDASERSGPRVGSGRGGVGGGGDPGSGGGVRSGGRAQPFGPGPGAFSALDTNDRRYIRWYTQLTRRVYDRLDFPHERMLEMDQGWSVYRIVVRSDGSLASRPRLTRSSGFGDLDQAARRAIEQAAPFAPLPSALSDGIDTHAVSMRVEHSNPMVQ